MKQLKWSTLSDFGWLVGWLVCWWDDTADQWRVMLAQSSPARRGAELFKRLSLWRDIDLCFV